MSRTQTVLEGVGENLVLEGVGENFVLTKCFAE